MPTGAQDIPRIQCADDHSTNPYIRYICLVKLQRRHTSFGPQKEAMEGKWDPLFQEYPGWVKYYNLARYVHTHTLKSPKIQVAIWEQHKWWNEMKGCNFLCKYVLCVYDVILDAFLISITVRLFIACLLQTFSYVVSMPRTAYTRCKLY